MHIIILSDGIPGHLHQALGLTDWLRAEGIPVTAEILDCQLRYKWLRAPLAIACNKLHLFPGLGNLIFRCYRLQASENPAQLVISAGGNTSFANIVLAHKLHLPNIFIGSPRRLRPHSFHALLTLEPVPGWQRNNLVMNFSPARLSDTAGETGVWALLLGGDGSGYNYRLQDWETLLNWARQAAEKEGIRWILAGSRRSPDTLRDLCQACLPARFIAANCWPNEIESQPLAQTLPRAERILCTEDSMSMLNESINLARPLLSLRPAQTRIPPRYRQALQRFEDEGLLQRLRICELEALRMDTNPDHRLSERVIHSRRGMVTRLLALIENSSEVSARHSAVSGS